MVVRERHSASATKPTEVRMCLEPPQTPTLEENIHRFNQAKIFSVFDVKDASQTTELTHGSSMLTTMHSPWGCYLWTRPPFDVSPAPEQFQRRLLNVLCGLDGVVNIADDIIVVGRGESSADASRDHDHTLINLRNYLSQHHLKLNPDKI